MLFLARIGNNGPIEDCLPSVMLDGRSLTAMAETQRTLNPYDSRPDTKYSEAWAAGVIACSLGLREIAIATKFPDRKRRETPDLVLTAADLGSVDVEVVRVHETGHARSRLYTAQQRVVKLLKSNLELKSPVHLRFALDYAKTGTPSEADATKLVAER